METELAKWMTPLFLAGTRVGALLTFAPFLGSTATSARVKAGLTAFLSLLVYRNAAGTVVSTPGDWVRVLFGEVAIGLVLGVVLHFVFDAAQLAGHLVGFQTGLSLVNLIDPNTEVETTVFPVFHQVIVLLIFLQLDVHHWLLRGVAKSFQYLPPGTVSATLPAASELVRVASLMWVAGVQIAAPIIVATVLADLALGYLGKASPQLPVLFVGFSLKSLLGIAVLAGSLAWWPIVFERWFLQAIAGAEALLGGMR